MESPNISFSGAGFLGIYHCGVAACILEHCPRLINDAKKIYACSAGSILGACIIGGICMGEACEYTLDVVRDATSRFMGPFHPGFRLVDTVRSLLNEKLPPDCYQKCSGRLFISLTKVSNGKNVIASEFNSNEELIDCIICSCYIPFFCGLIPPKYRNEYYVDGGLSNNLPLDANTISVQPWEGAADICPRDKWYSQFNYTIANSNVALTPSNLVRMGTMLYPSSVEQVSDFCQQGFNDAYEYLRLHGYLKTDPKKYINKWKEAIERKKKDNKKSIISEEWKSSDSNEFEEIDYDGEDSGYLDDNIFMETPTLDLPKHVTDQLHKAKNSASEVSENSLMDIIMFPLHFWTETAKSMTGLGHKAAHFGLDMAVRKLHTRGLIKSSSSMQLLNDADPTPNYDVDF